MIKIKRPTIRWIFSFFYSYINFIFADVCNDYSHIVTLNRPGVIYRPGPSAEADSLSREGKSRRQNPRSITSGANIDHDIPILYPFSTERGLFE